MAKNQTREEYAVDLFGCEDEELKAVKEATAKRGMPPISVPAELGRLLTLLVRTKGAGRALEIGVLGGYSGICIARGLKPDGTLTSLELSPDYASFAHGNLTKAGFGERVTYRVGPAAQGLQALAAEGLRFDFVFIDADKPNYPLYLNHVLDLVVPGALICADNVLQGDRVLDPGYNDDSVRAMRLFNERLATDPRLESVLLPLRDGFAVARVK